MTEKQRQEWRDASIAEQRARWALEDAQAAKDVEDKKATEAKDWRKRLKEAAASSAVHAGVGGLVGGVLGWLLWRKK